MLLSPDGGATPAPRREGDREASTRPTGRGMVFRGKLDIPMIDWRHYLEPFLDMHNSHQSFAARQRLLNYDGDASNQVIWFTAARARRRVSASTRRRRRSSCSTAGWRTSPAHPELGRGREQAGRRSRLAASTRTARCSHAATDVWDGILDDGPTGACAQRSRRSRRRGPWRAGRSRAASSSARLQPVDAAHRPRPVRLLAADRGRARPAWSRSSRQGVCDYRKRDAGLPPEFRHGHK